MPNSFGSHLSRTIRFAAVVTMAVGGAALGVGVASAAPVTCSSPLSPNDIQVSDMASCGAQATGTGTASASATESGTAVSVADQAGSATSYATGFGTALSAALGGGNSYAVSIGGGISRSEATGGITTIAVAGYGAGATAEAGGVDCVGVNSFALNLSTGRACIAGM